MPPSRSNFQTRKKYGPTSTTLRTLTPTSQNRFALPTSPAQQAVASPDATSSTSARSPRQPFAQGILRNLRPHLPNSSASKEPPSDFYRNAVRNFLPHRARRTVLHSKNFPADTPSPDLDRSGKGSPSGQSADNNWEATQETRLHQPSLRPAFIYILPRSAPSKCSPSKATTQQTEESLHQEVNRSMKSCASS